MTSAKVFWRPLPLQEAWDPRHFEVIVATLPTAVGLQLGVRAEV